MCMFKPKIPKQIPGAERQAMQVPKDMVDPKTGQAIRRRRGLWASIFTSPQGISGPPTTTGTSTGTGITGG